ncbi:MAG TPA: hypothetical protein VGI58_16225 [Streptosporangiaceae bacterium]|jgi:hypothetical protein
MSQFVAAAPRQLSLAGRLLAIYLTLCLLLIAQYLLGMVANLFVTVPARHPGAGASNYFGGIVSAFGWVIPNGPAWIAAHAALGMALAVAAFAAVVVAWPHASRAARWLSIFGALTIVGAGFNGMSFLNYGHDASSMIMAGLWALALACYLAALALLLAGRITGPRLASAPAGDSAGR